MRLILLAAILFLGLPVAASAHQPFMVQPGQTTVVSEPDISKAYYSRLNGQPAIFTVTSDVPSVLYLNILIPDVSEASHDLMVTIARQGELGDLLPIASLDSEQSAWKQIWEPYGGDHYLQGPAWRENLLVGTYRITVSSPTNAERYVLVIGEAERFTFKDILQTFSVLPDIKVQMFGKSATAAYTEGIMRYIVLGAVGIFILIMLVVGLIKRAVIRHRLNVVASKLPINSP